MVFDVNGTPVCSTFDEISHAPHLVRRQVVHPHDVDGLELRAQVPMNTMKMP